MAHIYRPHGPDKVWPKEIEIQGLCGDEGDIRISACLTSRPTPPALSPSGFAKSAKSEKPIGQWDEIRILVDAGHIEVFVNGVLQNLAWYRAACAGTSLFKPKAARWNSAKWNSLRSTRRPAGQDQNRAKAAQNYK